VWICDAARSALVLGSAQRGSVADAGACERAGVEIVRRRSGGGAVLVVPGELLWVDVVIPASDELWQHDVGRAFHWLGDVWQKALADCGVVTEVHRGALRRSDLSDLVCFAGLGPGEVVTATGAKLVGISQRRTRGAARFQCAVLARWDPVALVALLALDEHRREEAAAALADLATGLNGAGVAPDAVLDAFLRRLP
jgi:lipoate-protein ligase A